MRMSMRTCAAVVTCCTLLVVAGGASADWTMTISGSGTQHFHQFQPARDAPGEECVVEAQETFDLSFSWSAKYKILFNPFVHKKLLSPTVIIPIKRGASGSGQAHEFDSGKPGCGNPSGNSASCDVQLDFRGFPFIPRLDPADIPLGWDMPFGAPVHSWSPIGPPTSACPQAPPGSLPTFGEFRVIVSKKIFSTTSSGATIRWELVPEGGAVAPHTQNALKPGEKTEVHIRGTDPNSVNYGTTLDNVLQEHGTIVIENPAKRKRKHAPRR